MTKLKLGPLPDDRTIKVTVEIRPNPHRDMVLYGELLGHAGGQGPVGPVRLIVPILERFIATDRGFAKEKRSRQSSHP